MDRPAGHPLELVVRCGEHKITRCLLRPGNYRLGQQRQNELMVEHDSISGLHAKLTVVSEEEIYLEDLQSSNGTFADGVFCAQPTRVHFTTEVQLGECRLYFTRGGLPAAAYEELPADFLKSPWFAEGKTVVHGSTSDIVEGEDTALGRALALRTLQPEAQLSAKITLRFVREAQLMAQLQHPQIPPVHDLRLNREGRLQYATRLLDGEPLSQVLPRLARHDAPTAQAWPLHARLAAWQKVADAVAYAHHRGVVHGSLRPEAVIVGEFGETLLLGWLFATLLPPEAEVAQAEHRVRVPGTAPQAPVHAYSAPEQVMATGIYDERVDIYGLGALLYALLCLQSPVSERDEAAMRADIEHGRIRVPVPPDDLAPGSPARTTWERLSGIAMEAMSASPAQRPARVVELQQSVAQCQYAVLFLKAGSKLKGLGERLVHR